MYLHLPQIDQSTHPVHFAVLYNVEALKLMLFVKGIDVNAKTKSGYTPLHLAAQYQPEVVPLLLDVEGIDVDVKARNGYTALHLAAKYQPEAVSMIENYLYSEFESEPEEIVLETSEHDDIKAILKALVDTESIINIINK
jgi:hypothetical protein